MTSQVSVIFVCERAEQLTGSGCCGKLEGDNTLLGGGEVFREVRAQQREVGLLHRTVREFFPQGQRVSILTIDPRNQLYLIPKLCRDVFRYRPGWRAGLHTALQLFSLPAVIVNGRVISRRGETVDPDTLCHAVSESLEACAQSRS